MQGISPSSAVTVMVRPSPRRRRLPAGLGQRDRLLDELVEIDGQALFLGLIGAIEFAQPDDDPRRVFGGGEDGGERQRGVLLRQAMLGVAQQQLAETHDDAERVIEVVGDAARHGAERGEPLLLDDLLLRALELGQRLLEFDRALAHACPRAWRFAFG